MTFKQTNLPGVLEITLEPRSDERGFFARSWCEKEFRENGLNPNIAQCSVSFNSKKGTLRGMHFQSDPLPEAKTVRCTHGSVYDVVLDVRLCSPTFKHWTAVTLTAATQNA